jgi:murein DD-endopeptidase MepM/ murein hydrolase activator NlpD
MKKILIICFLLVPITVFGNFNVKLNKQSNFSEVNVVNSYVAPVTVTFEIDAKNIKALNDLTFVCFPTKGAALFSIEKNIKNEKWSYKYKYHYRFGLKDEPQSRNAIYNLPFKKGLVIEGGQGFHGNFSHKGNSKFAIDLRVPEGTPIYPARSGIVISTVSKFSDGGTEEKFKGKHNFVLIMHDDYTIGRYYHFSYKKIFVKKGQAVSRNTTLGLSGNTGYSSRPHLHLEIGSPADGNNFVSQEFFFSSGSGDKYTTKSGTNYLVDR